MENRIRRPASVWIAQVFMIIGALLLLLPLAMFLFLPGGIGITNIIGFVIIALIYLGLASLFLLAFWGMARRRGWGRWLGVGMLSLLVLVSILGQIVRPSGPVEYWEYDNARQAAAGLMAQLFILGLFLWLIYSLAFGKRATAFFTGREVETTVKIFP